MLAGQTDERTLVNLKTLVALVWLVRNGSEEYRTRKLANDKGFAAKIHRVMSEDKIRSGNYNLTLMKYHFAIAKCIRFR